MRGLPRQVRMSLEKARDSALLAVEVYNKPAIKFKSGGYICLMMIAWTALFHAIFFRKKIKPFYKKESGRYVKIEGDNKCWELDECLRQHFKTDTGNAVRNNLEFFIPLRNHIEHRSMPELDAGIFGECQAMLLNLDEMLEKEFGGKYCLRESLSFSLQLFPSSESLSDAVKHRPASKPVLDFIQRYRSTVSPDAIASGKYSFKAFLIQVANHKSEKALPIQFVHYDKLSEEERKQVSQFVAMVKFKEVPISNLNVMKASQVAKKVQMALGNPKIQRGSKQVDRFNVSVHSICWKKYGVRPALGVPNPEKTDYRYCIYDRMHNDYGYTQAWVDFLTEKLRDESELESLYKWPPSQR
jgi:Domain of unknown function (DUF3644)